MCMCVSVGGGGGGAVAVQARPRFGFCIVVFLREELFLEAWRYGGWR